MLFWNALDLTRKLGDFRDYYKLDRVHRSLDGTAGIDRAGEFVAPPATLAHYTWRPHCRGLLQIPHVA